LKQQSDRNWELGRDHFALMRGGVMSNGGEADEKSNWKVRKGAGCGTRTKKGGAGLRKSLCR